MTNWCMFAFTPNVDILHISYMRILSGIQPSGVLHIGNYFGMMRPAIALQAGKLFPPCDASGLERPMDAPLAQVVVTSVGHWRGEGLALVESV